MRAEHLREWLQEHRVGEAEFEAEATSDPEGWKRRAEEGGEGGREAREQTKWEQVVDLL